VPVVMWRGFLALPKMPSRQHRQDLPMTPLTPIMEMMLDVIFTSRVW
jgi:hypothetical protein